MCFDCRPLCGYSIVCCTELLTNELLVVELSVPLKLLGLLFFGFQTVGRFYTVLMTRLMPSVSHHLPFLSHFVSALPKFPFTPLFLSLSSKFTISLPIFVSFLCLPIAVHMLRVQLAIIWHLRLSMHRFWYRLYILIAAVRSTQPFALQTHTYTQPFEGPFSGTTRVSRCQKRTSGLYGAGED